MTTFSFAFDEDFTWQAGQYLHYVLPHEDADDRGEERWFTISSAPHEKEIRITTRFAEKSSSFKKALFALPLGATLEADGLEGDFVVEDPAQEFIFIAGGIGITPFRSILLDLDHRGLPIKGKLLYTNRDTDIVFKKELDELVAKHPDFKVEYVIDPQRIDEAYIQNAVPDLKAPLFYVSGPAPMVFALSDALKVMGVPEAHIKLDDFPGYE